MQGTIGFCFFAMEIALHIQSILETPACHETTLLEAYPLDRWAVEVQFPGTAPAVSSLILNREDVEPKAIVSWCRADVGV